MRAKRRFPVVDISVVAVVAVGAALGGVLRVVFATLVVARIGAAGAPLGTLAINVVGSLLIGVVIGALQSRTDVSPLWRSFLATGILGGFTTFSTFSYDAVGLATSNVALAGGYVAASMTLGIGAAFAGLALGRAL